MIVWFALWEAVGQADVTFLVPPLSGVAAASGEVFATAKFREAIAITLRSFALGMGLALAIGIPLGVLMARVEGVGRILNLWINVFVSAPISALVPVLMAVIGIGESPVVVTVFLFAVFVNVLDTQVGVRGAHPSLLEMARAFGAGRRDLCRKVLLLAALPEILAGVRLGAIRGVKGVVIGQLLVTIIGVGELFEVYSRIFLMEEFWTVVICVFAFAFAISEAIAALERRVEYYARMR